MPERRGDAHAARLEAAGEHPLLLTDQREVPQPREVFGAPHGRTPSEKLRRRAEEARAPADFVRGDAALRFRRRLESHVDAARDERDYVVRGDELDAERRVGREQLLDLAREEEFREGDRGGDAQRAADLVSGLGREDRLGAREEALGLDQKSLAVGGERDRAGRAIEEPHAEERLELKKLARGDGARDVEALRGLREAREFGNAHEGAEKREAVHDQGVESVAKSKILHWQT